MPKKESSYDDVKKYIELISEFDFKPQPINDKILYISNLLDKSLKNACLIIKKSFPKIPFLRINTENLLNNVFGKITNKHGFSAKSINWGFSPTEPQITGAIAHFLSYDNYGEIGRQRAIAFLKALSVPIDDNVKIYVEAEKGIYSKKRIDIYFEWGKRPNKSISIIEAKFGHIVTSGQLSKYKSYANNNSDNQFLFLLTNKGEANKRNIDWKPISWFKLLRNWEEELSNLNCNDDDFQRFKANLWEKIYGENK